MQAFEDPENEGNSSKYHTGELCIERCGNPAGTAWSPLWCFECNVKRMRKIDEGLEKISKEGLEKILKKHLAWLDGGEQCKTCYVKSLRHNPQQHEAHK